MEKMANLEIENEEGLFPAEEEMEADIKKSKKEMLQVLQGEISEDKDNKDKEKKEKEEEKEKKEKDKYPESQDKD